MKFNVSAITCAVVATVLLVSSGIAAEWPRPVIVPLPDQVADLAYPVVSLNGNWKFTLNPPEDFQLNSVDPAEWSDVPVPAEPWMQGLRIERDKEYPYKKRVMIPQEFAGQRIFLRFDGVYSVGRICCYVARNIIADTHLPVLSQSISARSIRSDIPSCAFFLA